MGAQQSKDELLYHEVNNGNLHGIRSLHSQGAGLEWMDKEGKNPLILACLRHDLLHVAKFLIELGANVNAYRPGSNAGTPLHHAAKKGLEQTVHLLLSHGASPFIVNDDCHTALDMAREKGHHKVVRAIESHFSLFSGWLREHYGPGFLEAFVPQLMSRKIWAVVLPCDTRNPAKLELAVYPELQVAKPRVVISLWKVHIDEPKFIQSDPSVVIIDKATRARYKFLSAHEGDKQQLQWFYNACRGLPQVNNNIPTAPVTPPIQTPLLVNSHVAATSTGVPISNPEDVELAMAINASIQTAIAEGVHDVHPNVQTSNSNGWGSCSDNSTNNDWGPPNVATPSQMSSQTRFDDPRTNTYNGWAVPEVRPSSSSEPSRNQNDTPIVAPSSSSSSSSSHEAPPTLAPSAPPIVAETFFSGPIQYPSIDSSPVDINVPTVYLRSGASEIKQGSSSASDNSRKQTTSEVKEDSGSASASGGCVICLDAPVEGACIPCGHMAGCMSCLREIELKNRGCPVCRAEIDQVVRLYAV